MDVQCNIKYGHYKPGMHASVDIWLEYVARRNFAIHASTLVDHEKRVKTLHRELWLKHKSLYRNLEMTLKSFNAWVIYRIKSIKLSMVTFILTLESVNEI